MSNNLDLGAIVDVLNDVIELLEIVKNDACIMQKELKNNEKAN